MSSFRKGPVWQFILITAAILLALAGCQPAQQPTAAPTVAQAAQVEQAYPAAQEGYPAPGQLAAEDAYPAPGGEEGGSLPGMAPARENRSKVTAQLISAQPDEAQPGYTRLLVKLLASEPAEGMDSVTDDLVDQEVELLMEAAQLPDLEPGDTFEAEVSWMGDEHGADYYILKLLKMLE